MAVKDFLLPDLGEGLTEGEIVSWLVEVGDTVDVDQPVAEIETAKAVVEVPSPFAGTVTKRFGEVGEEVEVGTPLVSIDSDAGAAAAGPDKATPDPVVPRTTPGAPAEDEAIGEMVPDARHDRPVDGEPGTLATEDVDDGGSGNVLVGYGTGGGSSRRRRGAAGNGRPSGAPTSRGPATSGGPGPVPSAAPYRPGSSPAAAPSAPPTKPASGGPGGRPLAKPPVRKLAKDLGVDLASLSGSGPEGSVTRDDVHAAVAAPAAEPAQAAPQPQAEPRAESEGVLVTAPDSSPLRSAPPNPTADEQRIPVRGVRKRISQQMTTSRREIPDATTWVDADATRLMELRARLNARSDAGKVSPLALVLRAVVAGLREIPMVNARLDVDANEIVVPRAVHLGFAAQTDRGLVVPVIRDADRRSTLGIAAELNRLAAAARAGTLKPDEMQGGTFTVSNYGSFGVDGGSAIINHPEAAILGVGRITDKPWVVDGALEVRKVLQLSIAFDHRILDGGEAAVFLRFVADCVEDPDFLLGSL